MRYAATRCFLECKTQQSEHSSAKQHQAGGLGDLLRYRKHSWRWCTRRIIDHGKRARQESRGVLGTRIQELSEDVCGSIYKQNSQSWITYKYLKGDSAAQRGDLKEFKSSWGLWNAIFRIRYICQSKREARSEVSRHYGW